MRRSRVSQAGAGLLALLLGVGLPGPALGGQAFEQLLEVLHANGTIDSDAYAALQEAAEEDSREAVRAARAPGAEGGVEIITEGSGLAVRSGNDEFKFHIGGRLDFEGAWYGDDDLDFGNGLELRRARIGVQGRAWRHWQLDFDVDFADDEVEIKNAFVDYEGIEWIRFRFGHFKEPFSLEEATSARYVTFMERALPNVLVPGRSLGAGVRSNGDRWSLALGVFGESIDQPDEGDEGWAVTTRGAVLPLKWDGGFVHLGGAVSYREFGDENEVRFRSRPESHVTGVRLVDTSQLGNIEDLTTWGLEAAAVLGPFSVQGEYIAARVDRGGEPSLDLDGWYAYLSWFLTGESRPYKASRDAFGRVEPLRPLRDGGIGALEVALRVSHVDLTDEDVIGGEQNNLTAGLNWHPARNLRFMANWVKVLEVDRPGAPEDGEEPSIFQVRAQLDF